MKADPMQLAVEYYELVGTKNKEGIKKYLHPDVEFTGPVANLKGKETVVQATHNFMDAIHSLTVRTKFGSEDQAMLVHESNIPGVTQHFPAAVLVSFRDGLIIKIEQFFDGSLFKKKKEEIFS